MIPQYNVHLINNKGSVIKVTGGFFNNSLKKQLFNVTLVLSNT